MANPIVQFIVRLRNELTPGVEAVTRSLGKMRDALQSVAASAGTGLERALQGLHKHADRLQQIGSAAEKLGALMKTSTDYAADFEEMLAHIGVRSNAAKSELESLKNRTKSLAQELGHKPEALLGVVSDLVTAGKTPADAEKLLGPIGKTAIATRAELKDVTKAALGIASAGVPVENVARHLDTLHHMAAKGNYQFGEMAAAFGPLIANAASAGFKGEQTVTDLAAAMVVLREGMADPSQAASVLTELMRASRSPEVIKNFQKHGVDMAAALRQGAAQGKSPLDVILEQTRDLLAKNKNLSAGELFNNSQAGAGINKLIEDGDRLKALRAEAVTNAGGIQRAYDTIAAGTKATMARAGASADNLTLTAGDALTAGAKTSAGRMEWLTTKLREFAEAHPALTATAAAVAGWGLAIGKGLGNLGAAAEYLPKTFVGMGTAIGGFFGNIAGKLSTAGTAIANAMRGIWASISTSQLGTAIGSLGTRLRTAIGSIGSNIGAMGGALVARIGAALGTAFAGLGALLLPVVGAALRGLIQVILVGLRLLAGPAGWALLAAQLVYIFRDTIISALDALDTNLFGGFFKRLGEIDFKTEFNNIIEAIRSTFANFSLSDIGWTIINSLLDGFKSAAGTVKAWVGDFVGGLKSLLNFKATPTIAPNVAASPGALAPGALAPGAPATDKKPGPGTGDWMNPMGDYTVPTPAPTLTPGKQSSATTNHNNIRIDGSANPEVVARAVLAAINRGSDAGMWDGAFVNNTA